jgi:hypothetical protein
MNGRISVAAVFLLSLCTSPAIATEGFGKMVGKNGRWTIYAMSDPMDDKLSCTALFDDRREIQLNRDAFAISLKRRGGLSAYEIRFDDMPASELTLASRKEKDIEAILMDEARFAPFRVSQRVRFRIYTLVGDILLEDIDLSEVPSTLAMFDRAKCDM